MAKGGGHNKGQTMRYRVIRSFDHEKPFRAAAWGLGTAMHDLRETLLVVNRTGSHLEAQVLDVETNEVVYEPTKCTGCREQWATESVNGSERWLACAGCLDELEQQDGEPPCARRAFFSGEVFCLICPAPDGPEMLLTSEDLPDGAICAGCGTDVLIASVAKAAEAEGELVEVDDNDEDVLAPDLPYDPNRYAPPAGFPRGLFTGEPIPIMPPSAGAGEIPIAGITGRGKTSLEAVRQAQRAAAEREAQRPNPNVPVARVLLDETQGAGGRNVKTADVAEEALVNAPAFFEAYAAPYTRTNKLPEADSSALLAALDRSNLPRAVWADGTVAVVAHGMLFTMQAEPHAQHGGPCGVWSVATPVGVRGMFSAEGAARFIRDRRTP